MRKLLFFLIVLGVTVFFVLPYIVLPAVLENLVARVAQDRLGLDERPDVKLESDPQWRMLQGEFSGGRISARGTELGGVRAENVAVDLDPFSVDVGESARDRTAVVEEPLSGRVRLTVSEGEVSRLARENADVPINGVEVRGGGVTVRSEASVLGATFPVEVEGGVTLDGNELVFRPHAVRAAGMTVPGNLADSLLAGTAFRYPVGGLPYAATLTEASTTDGAVVLEGNVFGVELGRGG